MVKYQLEIQLILFKNMKGGCVMDFFKKLSETVMDTASTISAKSTDMVEIGKLKLQRNQLENAIKDKKTEIGNIVYQAHKQNIQPDETLLNEFLFGIQDLENQVAAVDEKMRKDDPQPAQPSDGKVFCSQCGQELAPGAKFCNSCGQPQ
jgi:hypothetical protein